MSPDDSTQGSDFLLKWAPLHLHILHRPLRLHGKQADLVTWLPLLVIPQIMFLVIITLITQAIHCMALSGTVQAQPHFT